LYWLLFKTSTAAMEEASEFVDVPEFTVLSCADKAWISILSTPDNPSFSQKFVIRGWRRKSTQIVKKLPHGRKRKRRRINISDKPTKRSKPRVHFTTGPTEIVVHVPTHMDQGQQAVVNALAGLLPIDAKMNIFGFYHSVILVGVFYRHENLCWIVLNRLNNRLYITSHFMADALHLFKQVRPMMQLTEKQKSKKWTRQGVNDALCLFKSLEAMQQNQALKLNTLPSGVLRFTRTKTGFAETQAFLKGVGQAGNFLRTFTRTDDPPPGFTPITKTLTDSTCGWKVFRRTDVTGCAETVKKPCSCGMFARQLQKEEFEELSPKDAAVKIMTVLPSSLDKVACVGIRMHYKSFIEYVKENPRKLYFPLCDVTL